MADSNRQIAGAAILAISIGAATNYPAAAQTVVPTYNAVDAETLMNIIRSQSQVQITPDGTDPQGPVLRVQSPNGLNYTVFLSDCDGGQPSLCKSLTLSATLPPGAINFAQLNSFNEGMRYATAYFTDKGVPMLRMDQSIRGGVTADFLAYTIRIFLKVEADFVQKAK
jgi:hypothetical protein